MALSHVSVPSHRPTWDGRDCPRDSHVSHPTWLCPMCPSRPIVPHGTGGTVLGTPIVPPYMALSHVSVPSHRPTWDGRDCPRDSHVSHHTWLCPMCPSCPIVPHGTGRIVLGTPPYMALSHVSVPSHRPTWDGWDCPRDSHRPTLHGSVPVSVPSHRPTWDGRDCPRDSHVSHHTWLCPMCPSRPIVPHGMGGTVLGTPIVPHYMALSHVSVPSHRPTWDGWDCPRDSHRPTLHGSVPCVCPVPSSHMGWVGLS